MPIFIVRGRYTKESMAAMLQKPDDRAEALRPVFAAGGGRLIDYYVTFGDDDFLIVLEAPDEKVMLQALIAPAATGAVSDLKTCIALRSTEARDAFAKVKERAGDYRRPGG